MDKEKIKQVIKNNDYTFPMDEYGENCTVERMFYELESENLIDFSICLRETENDAWLQAEKYFTKLNSTIILNYDFPQTFESVDELIEYIEDTNKRIEEINTKLN